MATVMHVEDVGVEILNQVILGPMRCTCSPCIEEVLQIVVTFVVALEHGFDEEGDWVQKDLDSEGKDIRLRQRIVRMLPGCKDAKRLAESDAAFLRFEKHIYSTFKSIDSAKRRAVLYALGARCGKDKATINGLLATEAERLGCQLPLASEEK
ncbi:hypothetical protein EDB80DRAFT_684305 [Ilyonectria destructans]|nr:hypothetical protein EDB80DRAFT_684305 [Ilyonectria destructans]